jgi:hypothetical protein
LAFRKRCEVNEIWKGGGGCSIHEKKIRPFPIALCH